MAGANAAIVIPVHKPLMTELEKISFAQAIAAFKRRTLILVVPEEMDCTGYQASCPGLVICPFPAEYFKNVLGYNRLVLTPEFYERFAKYSHILIYQLDAFAFQDELDYWCSQEIDYIGAPWTGGIRKRTAFKLAPIRFIVLALTGRLTQIVGNSGFSLRNVRASIDCLKRLRKSAETWRGHDDYFWSFYVPAHDRDFRIASFEQGLRFAFEVDPARCYELNGKRLPFGCHAWEKFDPGFWRPFFEQSGFRIP